MKNRRVKHESFISRKDAQAHPNIIFLFGDNLQEKGYEGQAKELRGETDCIGIPTKKKPSMEPDAFFLDDEFDENKKAIDNAFKKIPKDKNIVIPKNGIGTGYARLEEKAPRTYKYLKKKLKELES